MRVEVLSVSDTGRRRRWTMSEKARIVEESLEPGAVAAEVARRHEISRSQIYDWRHRYRQGDFADVGGSFTRIVPTVAADGLAALPAPTAANELDNEAPPEALLCCSAPGTVEDVVGPDVKPMVIEFGDGARMTVPVGYDVDAAAQLISAIRGER